MFISTSEIRVSAYNSHKNHERSICVCSNPTRFLFCPFLLERSACAACAGGQVSSRASRPSRADQWPAVGGRWTNEPHGGKRIHNNILDLEPGTEYSWAVRAVNSGGVSGWALGPNFTTYGALPEAETMPPGSPESDRAVLVEFYWHLFEAKPANSGPIRRLTENHWLSRSTLAKWYGVKVNEEGRVVELSLDNSTEAIWRRPRSSPWLYAISEKALIALTRLTELRRLELYQGYLNFSQLPETIRNLQKLEYLDLRGNHLAGEPLPEAICDLSNLKYLNLHRTNFNGPLPDCFGNLTQLEYLDISEQFYAFRGEGTLVNSVIGVLEPLPSSIGNLQSLKHLNLFKTGIKTIPPEIGQLTQLEELDVTGNPLTGRLPPELGSLRNLKNLFIWGAGPLPPEWGQMESLERLRVTGPYTVGQSSPGQSWWWYDLDEAGLDTLPALEGTLPPEWGQMGNLKSLYLKGFLSGPLPPEWGQLHKLEFIDLNDLELTGPLPAEWGQMASLKKLLLRDNLLSGPLPAEIGDMTSLVELELGNNLISGPIPLEIRKLWSLERLVLYGNQLSGSIPNLSGLGSLRSLNLGNNQLSGRIPSPFPSLPSIVDIALHNNQFTGPFPDISHLFNLRFFVFEGNDDLEVYGNALEWKGCVPQRLLPPKLNHHHPNYEGNFGRVAVCQNE